MSGLRISTTTLESFRLWSDPEQEWMHEADLVDTILGRFTPTPEILIGQAYHCILENPDKYRSPNGYVANEYFFGAEVVTPMLAKIDRQGTFEVKATKEILGNTIVCKADHISGMRVVEFKTTFNNFDAEKYMNSIQWRIMALAFEAASVTYEVACFTGRDTVELRAIESLPVYPYPGLLHDCEDLVRKFVHYVKLRGLDGHLRQKQVDADLRAGFHEKQLTLEGFGVR